MEAIPRWFCAILPQSYGTEQVDHIRLPPNKSPRARVGYTMQDSQEKQIPTLDVHMVVSCSGDNGHHLGE